MKHIHWKKAIDLIKNKSLIEQGQIDFNNEKVPIKDVIFFNENGFRIPTDLVEYDDDNLDYSDIPAITDEDITSGKLERIFTTDIPVKDEVAQWLVKSNINFNDLVIKLVNNFYQTTKQIQKSTTLLTD